MALAGCRILVLGDQRLPADHHRLGGTLSLNGAPALPAWTLTHIVADGWAAVTARAPSLARRHHPAQPDGPPPRGSAQLVFVRPRWLEECLRTGRRAAEGPHAFTAGDEVRRRGSGDDEGRPRQLRRTEAVQSAPDAARAAARPAVPMALPASASRTFNHRHGATLDCRQLTPSRGWRIAEQELGVWVSDPPPLLRTSRPQPVAAFDFDNTLATCNNQAGGPQDWEFRKDVRSGADMGVRESLRWLHQQGYLIVVMSNNSVNSLKNVEGKSGIHAKLARKLGRIENLAAAAGVPLLALVGVAGNSERTNMCRFYKPNTGMWDWLCETAAPAIGAQICRSSSFFVGDSAGRRAGQNGAGPKGKITSSPTSCRAVRLASPESITIAGDFGSYDMDMARDAGLRFFLETEFFCPGRPPTLPDGRRLFG